MSSQSRFARSVEAGIRSGAVNPRGHLHVKPLDLACNHPLGSGDETYAHTYVTVTQADGTVRSKTSRERIGKLDGLTATVAVTGETVAGKNRREVLTNLLLAHNAHIGATR